MGLTNSANPDAFGTQRRVDMAQLAAHVFAALNRTGFGGGSNA
jgi:hypothetical protein